MNYNVKPIRSVLITGGAGYIGSVLVPRLLAGAYQVTVIDRFFFGGHTLAQHPNLTLLREDTRCLTRQHFADIDCVIDLAALSNDPSGEYFPEATWSINHQARVRTARLAREMGVKRYLLPSSCSVYGYGTNLLGEESPTNPLSHYARANKAAEDDILPLAGPDFSVTVLRLATVFGYSPRMRLDLAINRMLYEGWSRGVIPVLRDGTQYRPFLHIEDAGDALIHFLNLPQNSINAAIFNIGSSEQTLQLGELAQKMRSWLGEKLTREIRLSWYGAPDKRSYQVSFEKLKRKANWTSKKTLLDGCDDILIALNENTLTKNRRTITLDWYRHLEAEMPPEASLYGGILNVDSQAPVQN